MLIANEMGANGSANVHISSVEVHNLEQKNLQHDDGRPERRDFSVTRSGLACCCCRDTFERDRRELNQRNSGASSEGPRSADQSHTIDMPQMQQPVGAPI